MSKVGADEQEFLCGLGLDMSFNAVLFMSRLKELWSRTLLWVLVEMSLATVLLVVHRS